MYRDKYKVHDLHASCFLLQDGSAAAEPFKVSVTLVNRLDCCPTSLLVLSEEFKQQLHFLVGILLGVRNVSTSCGTELVKTRHSLSTGSDKQSKNPTLSDMSWNCLCLFWTITETITGLRHSMI